MAIEGSLKDVSLADICQLLAMGRKKGCLAISNVSNFGHIFFDGGRVVYASIVNRPDKLGTLLVKNEVITEEQLDEAIAARDDHPGKRLGEILVFQEALTQEELERYISLQIEEAVYLLFTWDEGGFQFQPDVEPGEGVFLISVSADALLMEGARRVDEWSVMEKKITSMDLIFALERNPLAEDGVELSDAQRRIVPLLDGERTVEDIAEDSGIVEFETGKALYGLIQAGFVAQVGRRASDDDQDKSGAEHVNLGLSFYRSGMLEDSVRELKLALQSDPNDPQARQHLGLISLRAGRPQEALVHFNEMSAEAEPTYALLRNRALALERMGRYGKALEVLSQAQQMEPDDPDVMLQRGIVLLKSGQGLDALKTFHSYRGRMGKTTPPPLFYAYFVLAAGMAGDLDRAIEIGREGLGHYPNEGTILVNTGGVIAHKGEAEAAAAFFNRAIEEGGNPAQAHKALGDEALKAEDKAQAKKHYEAAIKIDPRLGENVYVRLGALALETGNQQEAGHYWRRALEINPDNNELQARVEELAASPGA